MNNENIKKASEDDDEVVVRTFIKVALAIAIVGFLMATWEHDILEPGSGNSEN